MLYMYDPINNVKTPTNYKLLSGITGMKKEDLAVYKTRGSKITSINCYVVDDNTSKERLYEFMLKQKPVNEVWKEIDPSYQISNYGRVRRLYMLKEPRLLRPYIRKGQWLVIKIHGKEKFIHKLVAEAFLEVPPGLCCYHKNGNIHDNYADNLGFATRKELGLMFAGTANGTPVSKVDLITGEVLESYENMAVAGRENYLHRETIRQVVAGKDGRKSAAGFGWIKCVDF